jgi:hypothetical protein
MRRHIPKPFDAGRLHARIGIQPLGDGVGDDGLAFLFQQVDQPLLLCHQPINLRRFTIQECGDSSAFSYRGDGVDPE